MVEGMLGAFLGIFSHISLSHRAFRVSILGEILKLPGIPYVKGLGLDFVLYVLSTNRNISFLLARLLERIPSVSMPRRLVVLGLRVMILNCRNPYDQHLRALSTNPFLETTICSFSSFTLSIPIKFALLLNLKLLDRPRSRPDIVCW